MPKWKSTIWVSPNISVSVDMLFSRRLVSTNHITATATNLIEVVTDASDVSSNPSYVPACFSSNMDKMNYIDRLTNVILYTITSYLTKFVSEPAAQSLQYYLPIKFNFIDAVRESSLFLVNSDELLDFPRLINRKIIFIGRIGIPEVKALNQDYRSTVEHSEGGVVLVSFGSLVKSEGMSVENRKIFEDAFCQLPKLSSKNKVLDRDQKVLTGEVLDTGKKGEFLLKITFLWKFENEGEGEEKGIANSSNIDHRKLLTFISHCGLNSLIESVNAEVPLICMPLFADQFRNAMTAKNRNVAIVLSKENLTTDGLVSAVRAIIYEDRLIILYLLISI
uniref:glucuronosyltransferase n=1 Tax=Setaria digitata TaxID=48799 RepID=A0A915PV95_9BILA